MSEAKQDDSRKQDPGQGTAGSSAAFLPGQADSSFDRLLEQLEAESGRPAADAGASQIFSAPPAETVREGGGSPAIHPGGGDAFAPARPALDATAFAPGVPVAPTAALPTLAAVPPRPPEPARPMPEPAGEFTRIFTQLPTPRSAPPAILAEVAAPPVPVPSLPPAAGEFTQFFQALDPSKVGAVASPPAGVPNASALSPAAVEAQEIALPTPVSAPGPAALQAFQPATPSGNAQAFAPSAAAPQRESAPQPEQAAAQPGAFTAFFQAAAAPAPARETAPASVLPEARGRTEGPAFPASFADPAPTQPSKSGGFTELLQSLSNDGTSTPMAKTHREYPAPDFSPASDNPRAEAFSPSAHSFPLRTSGTGAPFAPAPASGVQPAGRGASRPGEFTELMQSLQSSQPSVSKPAGGAPPQAPFFGAAQPFSGGPSEFTRVMQGSAARSAETPVATFAPAPQSGGGAAVGLPIAAPQIPKPAAPALPAVAAKSKLQAMMPWLLAANGALLLLLIALAFLFLRHKHL